MKVDFTGRGVNITDQIRSFTESKLDRVKRLIDDMHDVSVVLSTEKYRHKAEIKFLSHKRSFHGTEETNDMFQAIDHVVTKLESQVKKHKNKLTAKKRSTTESIRVNVLNIARDTEPPEGDIQIIRTDSSEVRPMSLDEAVDELQKLNRQFVFFRNQDNGMINVVYTRRDGHIGLIEPGS